MGKTLRTKTLYQDREWLYQKYVREKLSTVEIARQYRDEVNQLMHRLTSLRRTPSSAAGAA